MFDQKLKHRCDGTVKCTFQKPLEFVDACLITTHRGGEELEISDGMSIEYPLRTHTIHRGLHCAISPTVRCLQSLLYRTRRAGGFVPYNLHNGPFAFREGLCQRFRSRLFGLLFGHAILPLFDSIRVYSTLVELSSDPVEGSCVFVVSQETSFLYHSTVVSMLTNQRNELEFLGCDNGDTEFLLKTDGRFG